MQLLPAPGVRYLSSANPWQRRAGRPGTWGGLTDLRPDRDDATTALSLSLTFSTYKPAK